MEEKNSLFVVLGVELGDFQRKLNQAGQMLQQHAQKMQDIGANLSTYLTAPIALFGATVLKTAGNFEAAMNTVQALSGATGRELEILTAKARKMGATTAFSATEAAQGIETLLKNGLNVRQVMGGALDATLLLASAAKTSLANAADIATDAMLQFNLKASDLTNVVNKIAGVTIASKFGIDDVRLALANAGGVAGAVGVEFEDFATAIAATSSAFSSGADAGTSFKTFLTALNPKSKEAAALMQRMGLSFFDSTGKMDSMAVIAQKLQDSFSGLSEKQKLATADTLFGTDAMRTALLLAQQGSEGFNKLAESIGKVSAAEMAAVQMRGFNGAIKTLSSSFEALQISIASSGLLEFFTGIINGAASLLQSLSQLRPGILQTITVFAGLVAAVGPVLFVVGKLAAGLPVLWATIKTGIVVTRTFAATTAILVAKILAIAAVVAGAIAAVVAIAVAIKSAYDVFTGFRNVVDSVGAIISRVFDSAVKAFMRLFDIAGKVVGSIVKYLGQFAEAMGLVSDESDKAKKITDNINQINESINNQNSKGFADAFKENFGGVVDFVTEGAKKAKKAIVGALFVPDQPDPTLGGTDGGPAPNQAQGAGMTELAEAAEKAAKRGEKVRDIFAELQASLNLIGTKAAFFGATFDANKEKAAALQKAMNDLLEQGVDPNNEKIKEYKSEWEALTKQIAQSEFDKKIAQTLTGVSDQLGVVDNKAKVFGLTLEQVGKEKAEIIRAAMTTLLNEGIAPTDERLLALNTQLASFNTLAAAVPAQQLASQMALLVAEIQKGAFSFENFQIAIASTFAQMGQEVAQGGKDLADFAKSAVNSIRRVISGLIAQGIAAVVSKTLATAGVTGPFAVVIAGAAGAAASALFNSIIPKFAEGGIVSGPTIGLMGEYAGARTNPEVIAPLSKLQDMLGETGPGMGEVVDAIYNNPPTNVTIDKDGFATSIEQRFNRTQIVNRKFNWASK